MDAVYIVHTVHAWSSSVCVEVGIVPGQVNPITNQIGLLQTSNIKEEEQRLIVTKEEKGKRKYEWLRKKRGTRKKKGYGRKKDREEWVTRKKEGQGIPMIMKTKWQCIASMIHLQKLE